MNSINLFPIPNFPLVQPNDDIESMIIAQLAAMGESLQLGDIIVIAQKIVSKAEGRLVKVADVEPDAEAKRVADLVKKDPEVVQIVLDDSRSIIRAKPGLLVTEQSAGWICANSGVDHSNIEPGANGEAYLSLLPLDADISAQRIRQRLLELTGIPLAIIINDSHGRAWRVGSVGVCIGCAGLPPIWDQRGLQDLFGHELRVSEECIADELAAAASLMMGQSDEGRPVVIIRGYEWPSEATVAPAHTIQRPAHMDAFR